MSSRALRKAQKELEERQRLEQLAQEEEDEEEEEEVTPSSKPKPSLFAMLGDADEEEDDDGEEENIEARAGEPDEAEEAEPIPTALKPSKKSRKKKKKAKGKARTPEPEKSSTASKAQSDLDEIDRALLALKITPQASAGTDNDQQTSTISGEMQQLYSVLSVDIQNLQAANEMRKLFGRAAVQTTDDEPGRARQRGRGGQQHGIAAAVAGRNAPGRNLASLGLRRNIFIQGKEEWPRATTGGLGMEVVSKNNDGTVEYRFVHNRTYQGVQRDFETCVASMDPDRMVQLLHFNPYHISTLLQVSEIAKQQRDNATASDLLERALFTFGRAVHSTFSSNLSQGKARLDFRRPENREFWLAVWRYMLTLGIRATWRTAFEWAKLLLSLSPEEDPYCIRLLIDQLALRGREAQTLVNLIDSDALQRSWKIPPNLAFSAALAHDRLKNPSKARTALRLAIQQYPWIAARLCKELDISPIPKSVWGKEPSDPHQELLTQLYVPKARDLWNTPEATSLLGEVAYSFDEPLNAGEDPYWLADIDETNLARHVILTDDRELLAFVPPRIKQKYSSVSDPLPPPDNIVSYSVAGSGASHLNEAHLLSELEAMRIYFSFIDLGRNITEDTTEEDLLRLLEQSGTSIDEFRRHTQRVQVLRAQLQQLGVQVVFDGGEGNRAPRDEEWDGPEEEDFDEDTDSDT